VTQTLKRRNPALLWVGLSALIFLVLILFMPFLQNLFHFDALAIDSALIAVAAGVLCMVWFEVFKILVKKN
jgi:P-type Ca2+ transporter type 2C